MDIIFQIYLLTCNFTQTEHSTICLFATFALSNALPSLSFIKTVSMKNKGMISSCSISVTTHLHMKVTMASVLTEWIDFTEQL